MFNESNIGKIYEVSEISKGKPCKSCNSCIRMRLMEMGLMEGEKIEIASHSHGLWKINILTEKENLLTSIALRNEELERVCVL